MPFRNAHQTAARDALEPLAREQSGVVSAAQALNAGLSERAIRRSVDRGDWRRLHQGVYLVSAVPPTLPARMWAARLAAGGRGVVAGQAAGHYWGVLDGDLGPEHPVLLFVPESMHLIVTGVAFRRVPDPWSWAHPARRPPVLSLDHTLLDVVRMAGAEAEAVAVLLRACRERRTTPARLRRAAGEHRRLRRRALIDAVCDDMERGLTSPLERRYDSAARRHGLPRGRSQVRSASWAGAVTYRDVQYDEYGVLVELDGRLGHEGESEVFRDQFRDNAATLAGWATLRFGWLAVAGEPCSVAQQVGALLQSRGWPGRPSHCGSACSMAPSDVLRHNLVASGR